MKKTKKEPKAAVPQAPIGTRPARRVHLSEVGKIDGLKAEVEAPDFGIVLRFENATNDGYRVNLTGGVLTPSDSDYQRLLVVGTEHKVDAKGVHLPATNIGHCVFVPPQSSIEVELDTCCMDHPLAPPDGNAYKVSNKMAPERLVKAARARCASVTLGASAPVTGVGIDLVQGVCWDEESDEDSKKMEKILSCGRY
jgi:hypothetical protein